MAARETAAGAGTWLFRSIFPSWEFFGSVAPLARVLLRPRLRDGTMGEWHELWSPPFRRTSSRGAVSRALRLLVNPEGNLWLRRRALLDEFVDGLAAGGGDGASVAERWIVTAVRLEAREIASNEDDSTERVWQWCVAIDSDEPAWICPRLVDEVERADAEESTK